MSLVLLIIAFVLTGLGSITNKALIEWGLAGYTDLYMLAFYSIATVLGITGMMFQRSKATATDRWVGSLMGISGALGMLFLLVALKAMPGIVAFPVRSLGNLVLTALVSIVAWKERLSRSQWLGIVLALIAIWLIS